MIDVLSFTVWNRNPNLYSKVLKIHVVKTFSFRFTFGYNACEKLK